MSVEGAPASRISEPSIRARDAAGRELDMRRLTSLDRLRLFKAVGPTLSQNAAYLGMAMLAYSVSAVDGVPVPAPASEIQLEGLVAKLGDDGLACVAEALFPETGDEDEAPRTGN